jgi:hypothetical protein
VHLLATPTTNMAVEQVRIEQMALQPQLMIDTVLAQALTKQTATQPQNTTSTVQNKAQSKRQHLVTPHTINMALKQEVIRQTLTAQPHLMTNTVEKRARSKQIPLAEQPNTTATAEKSEVLSNKSLWGRHGIFNIINQLNIMLTTNLKHKFV